MSKAVYLEWDDSASTIGEVWSDIRQVKEMTKASLRCASVGFVIDESDKAITIASSIDGEPAGNVAGHMTIPKAAITKRRVVRWKK